MSLLPIIYTSLAIFFGTFITILIISYISYKFKSERKNSLRGVDNISQSNNSNPQQKLAHVPIYSINQSKNYQANNYRLQKRNVNNHKESVKGLSNFGQSTRYVRESDYDTVVSRPRIQVVKRLSRSQDEPFKMPIKNVVYAESSLYRYYAQG